jgi:hypothetical protein
MGGVGPVTAIAIGVATLLLSVFTAVGAARASSERRPAQRAAEALQFLRHLDAVDQLDKDPKALSAGEGIETVRRELIGIVRQNAAVFTMRQRESVLASFFRTLLFVEGLFTIVFGGYLPLRYPGVEQSVTLSIVFLISGLILTVSGTILGYRHQRRRAAQRLAGAETPGFWTGLREVRRIIVNRRAVRRSRRDVRR